MAVDDKKSVRLGSQAIIDGVDQAVSTFSQRRRTAGARCLASSKRGQLAQTVDCLLFWPVAPGVERERRGSTVCNVDDICRLLLCLHEWSQASNSNTVLGRVTRGRKISNYQRTSCSMLLGSPGEKEPVSKE